MADEASAQWALGGPCVTAVKQINLTVLNFFYKIKPELLHLSTVIDVVEPSHGHCDVVRLFPGN